MRVSYAAFERSCIFLWWQLTGGLNRGRGGEKYPIFDHEASPVRIRENASSLHCSYIICTSVPRRELSSQGIRAKKSQQTCSELYRIVLVNMVLQSGLSSLRPGLHLLPRDALVHSAVLRLHVVRLSVCLSVCL